MTRPFMSEANISRLHTTMRGGTSLDVFQGHIDRIETAPQLRGRRWRGQPGVPGTALKMLTDIHVRKSRDAVVDPVARAKFAFTPGDGTPAAAEAARFQNLVWFHPQYFPFSLRLGRMLRDLFSFGFSVDEVAERVVDISQAEFPLHPGGGKAVGIADMHERPAWSIEEWRQRPEDGTRLRSVLQYAHKGADVRGSYLEIPASRFLRMTWEQSDANFEGNPIQRGCYGPWFIKRVLGLIEAQNHEMAHKPVVVVTRPSTGTQDDDDILAKSVANWRANNGGYIMAPDGYAIELKAGSSTTDINATIERLDWSIAYASGTGFVLMGKSNSSGSYALSKTQGSQYEVGLSRWTELPIHAFNMGMDGYSVVHRIHMLNYGSDVAVPTLEVQSLPTQNWLDIFPVLTSLVERGLVRADDPLEDMIRAHLRLTRRDATTTRTQAPSSGQEGNEEQGDRNE